MPPDLGIITAISVCQWSPSECDLEQSHPWDRWPTRLRIHQAFAPLTGREARRAAGGQGWGLPPSSRGPCSTQNGLSTGLRLWRLLRGTHPHSTSQEARGAGELPWGRRAPCWEGRELHGARPAPPVAEPGFHGLPSHCRAGPNGLRSNVRNCCIKIGLGKILSVKTSVCHILTLCPEPNLCLETGVQTLVGRVPARPPGCVGGGL